jgi:endonuclease I
MNFPGLRYYILTLLLAFYILFPVYSQPPGYYSPAQDKTGAILQQALHDIIDNHTVQTYNSLPEFFQKTDKKTNGTVWDMYSDIPGGTPAYVFYFGQDECGNYTKEGDCFNREHSFPKSWFGGEVYPMYSDLFHLYPTDGWVNNKRGNYPFGITSSPEWTSTNGSRLGPSSYPGYTGKIFEPVNAYKGDFARTMFYMAVRYYGEDTGWTGSDMVTGSQLRDWALKMCMEWHTSDPVSQKEIDRNDSVYVIQGNRNPFIDNPAFAELIWGTQNLSGKIFSQNTEIIVYPNPSTVSFTIELPVPSSPYNLLTINDISGRIIYTRESVEFPLRIPVNKFKRGIYFITVTNFETVFRSRIIISPD